MTLVAWMLYTLLVGTLLALTARGFDEVCRLAARPSRWVWIGALVLTVVLAGLAPRRTMSLLGPVPAMLTSANAEPSNLASDISARSRTADLSKVHPRSRPFAGLPSTIAAAWQHIPPSVNRYLAVLWGSLSALALLLLVTVYLRFRRVRQGWPVAELQGVRVRIAVDGGPAVVGLMQPEIIIPHWLLSRSQEEQRVVLAHEREHLRARDPLLLAGACLAGALLPWHPAVWWMLSRLRLAVELDCDTRVLRQGVAPRVYGALLIDMAERCSGFPIAAPALADKASHLQQRLFAMKPLRLRFARARGSIVGAFALLCLLAACAAQVPVIAAQVPAGAARPAQDNIALLQTIQQRQQELERMIADLLTSNAQQQSTTAAIEELKQRQQELAAAINAMQATQGQQSGLTPQQRAVAERDAAQTEEQLARAVAQLETASAQLRARRQRSNDITMIDADSVMRAGSATRLDELVTTATGPRRLNITNDITTINADSGLKTAPIRSLTDLLEDRVPGLTVQRTAGTPGDPSRLRLRGTGSALQGNDPIVIVDGVRVYAEPSADRSGNLAGGAAAPSPLDYIDPNSIEKIEVLKGPSAAALYGQDAANGVIVITTKKKP